jgi:hypothetical protein
MGMLASGPAWLVGMSDKETKSIREGCGYYDRHWDQCVDPKTDDNNQNDAQTETSVDVWFRPLMPR